MREHRNGARRLLVATTNFGGGTGTHLAALLGRTALEDWDVHLLCHGRVEVEPPAGVGVTERESFGALDRFPLAQLRRAQHLHDFVRRWQPHLVHAYFFWPCVYARLLKMSGVIRYLVENREDEGFNLGPREYGILRRTSHVPDRVICVSQAVRGVVVEREGVPPDRVRVIPNGVRQPDDGKELEDAKESVTREFGLAPGHLVVGMVANLNRAVKGVQHLLDAVPTVRDAVPEARFLIVGDGPDREALEARARELGVASVLVFTGFRTDVARLYRAMDVSVLASLSEGLSITVLESMSHGLPVVATRVGGNPEVVRHGETGFLVPPADPEALARALVRILKNGSARLAMGREGRRTAREEFSLERVARRYRDIYGELLGEEERDLANGTRGVTHGCHG